MSESQHWDPMNDPPEVRQPREFPSPWARSDRPVARRIVRPLEQFVSQEAGSGAILFVAAIAALVWANAAPASYEDFWHTETVAGVGSLRVGPRFARGGERRLDGGLLLRRRPGGEARVHLRRVARPQLRGAAGRSRRSGPWWGPRSPTWRSTSSATATWTGGRSRSPPTSPLRSLRSGSSDGALPAELRTFLLTLAVVDDLATIVVIAVFYSQGISLAWLGGGLLALAAVAAMQRIGVRALTAYVFAAGAVWLAVHESGVHATIAGVALGLLTPARSFYPASGHERGDRRPARHPRSRD